MSFLFVFFVFFTPGILFSAHIESHKFISSDDAFCSLITYDNKVFCYSKSKIYIINSQQEISKIAVPKNPGFIEISRELILARLSDDIILLLDTQKKKALKIHGGDHNNSPREHIPEPLVIKDYKFVFEREQKILKVIVEHKGKQWMKATKVTGIRREEKLKLDKKNYSVCLDSLYIQDESSEKKIIVGRGARLPVVLSKSKKLLAIGVRSENAIKIFDAKNKSIVATLKVGNLAYQPVINKNTLYATWFDERAVYSYDLGPVLD